MDKPSSSLAPIPDFWTLSEGFMQMANTQELHDWLSLDPGQQVVRLYAHFQERHKQQFNRPFAISKNSFVTEFYAHLIAAYYIHKYPRLLQIILTKKFHARIRKSCEAIDCGEKQKDPNRWFWDLFAWTYRLQILWYKGLHTH